MTAEQNWTLTLKKKKAEEEVEEGNYREEGRGLGKRRPTPLELKLLVA